MLKKSTASYRLLGYCFGGIFPHCKVNDDDLTVHQVY